MSFVKIAQCLLFIAIYSIGSIFLFLLLIMIGGNDIRGNVFLNKPVGVLPFLIGGGVAGSFALLTGNRIRKKIGGLHQSNIGMLVRVALFNAFWLDLAVITAITTYLLLFIMKENDNLSSIVPYFIMLPFSFVLSFIPAVIIGLVVGIINLRLFRNYIGVPG